MLENTLEILQQLDPLLDAGEMDSAGELLSQLDRTSLRAVLIHVVQARGSETADALGRVYLRQVKAA